MTEKETRKNLPSYWQLRSLKQYKDMTDEEFDLQFADMFIRAIVGKDYEEEIAQKLAEFAEEYDIEDMKINDRLVLRTMMQAILTVEDLNKMAYNLRGEGISQSNIIVSEKVNRMIMESLQSISRMQDDLKITRKIRKGDSEISVLNYIESLKKKAKDFYDKRMQVVTCPKCKKWVFSGWFLFPKAKNKIMLVCESTTDDGKKCGEIITITSKELVDNRGYSEPSLFPESLV